MKFIACKTKAEFTQAAGFDWAKIVKVDGGYIGFGSLREYETWKNQK